MHNNIKYRLPLLAGACALALTFAPAAMAAGAGGGHVGGMGGMGAMRASPMTTFPSTPHPMPAPPDHPSNPSSPPDTNPHAPFHKFGDSPAATPDSGNGSGMSDHVSKANERDRTGVSTPTTTGVSSHAGGGAIDPPPPPKGSLP